MTFLRGSESNTHYASTVLSPLDTTVFGSEDRGAETAVSPRPYRKRSVIPIRNLLSYRYGHASISRPSPLYADRSFLRIPRLHHLGATTHAIRQKL